MHRTHYALERVPNRLGGAIVKPYDGRKFVRIGTVIALVPVLSLAMLICDRTVNTLARARTRARWYTQGLEPPGGGFGSSPATVDASSCLLRVVVSHLIVGKAGWP